MKIIIEKSMSDMTEEEQEEIWTLSHENEVYEKDKNGTLWRILDLSNRDKTDVTLIRLNAK